MKLKPEKIYKLHAEFYKALSHYKRLEILDCLKDNELQAKDILEIIDISKSGLSQHMALMTSAGIVKSRKEGVKTYYSVNEPQITTACENMCRIVVKQLAEAGEIAKEFANA